MKFSNLAIVTLFVILFQACDFIQGSDENKSDILKDFYGVYDGYCVVGLLQGKSTIEIQKNSVRINYSVIVPHNVEETVLGTGVQRTATESGVLKNLHFAKDDNGTQEILGDWVNDDKTLGSGKFRIFLSNDERNVITCQIYNQGMSSSWQYYTDIKYSDKEFSSILNQLCTDTSIYNKLFINKTSTANSIIDVESLKRQLEKKDSLLEVSRICPDFFAIDEDSVLSLKVSEYVTEFYNSLEQTKLENEEGTPFKKDNWKKFLYEGISYSENRLSKLTGQYHDHYNMKLADISSINKNKSKIRVKTKVEYAIYELGEFMNEEELVFERKDDRTIFVGWYDIKSTLSQNYGYEGSENIDGNELYNWVGSNFKTNSNIKTNP